MSNQSQWLSIVVIAVNNTCNDNDVD